MATFVFFHEFKGNLGLKLFNLNTDTFNAVLSNVAPNAATDDELADITQIANGNGYTTGGVALTGVAWAETGAGTGIWKWTHDDFSWTASAGSMADFRYVVWYDDTSTNDKLIGYVDAGSTISLAVGNTFTADVGSDGVFQLS